MTEPTIAKMFSYSSPDGKVVETTRVTLSGLSLRATGHIVSLHEPVYGASYAITVDSQGRTRRITVNCVNASGERSLTLTRSPGGPWIAESAVGSVPQPALDQAVDVYLAGSAFATSLPVRRLKLQSQLGAEASVAVAVVSLPDLAISPAEHSGRTESVDADGAWIAYTGYHGDHRLRVDTDGIFRDSEGVAARVS